MYATTIRVSKDVKKLLDALKIFDSESYSDVILDLIEDHLELNPQFKKKLEKAFKEIKEGKYKPMEEVKW